MSGVDEPNLDAFGDLSSLDHIESATGLPVFAFPKEREFFVELKLPLDHLLDPAEATDGIG